MTIQFRQYIFNNGETVITTSVKGLDLPEFTLRVLTLTNGGLKEIKNYSKKF